MNVDVVVVGHRWKDSLRLTFVALILKDYRQLSQSSTKKGKDFIMVVVMI